MKTARFPASRSGLTARTRTAGQWVRRLTLASTLIAGVFTTVHAQGVPAAGTPPAAALAFTVAQASTGAVASPLRDHALNGAPGSHVFIASTQAAVLSPAITSASSSTPFAAFSLGQSVFPPDQAMLGSPLSVPQITPMNGVATTPDEVSTLSKVAAFVLLLAFIVLRREGIARL